MTVDNLETKVELSSIVVIFLRHLCLLAQNKEFFDTFSKVKAHLVIHILFPFLITSQAEKDTMIEDPIEHVSYLNDITYNQVSLSKFKEFPINF